MKTVDETSGTTSVTLILPSQGSKEERERERGTDNIFENIIVRKFPRLGKETVSQI